MTYEELSKVINSLSQSMTEVCAALNDAFGDLLDNLMEMITEVQDAVDDKVIIHRTIYKKPIKDYMIIFELLKIPIIF